MNCREGIPTPRRRRFRRLAVVGVCAAVVATTGLVTTYANAATPDNQVGFEGCTGFYNAQQGSGTFTIPDVASVDDFTPPPGQDVQFEPLKMIDEEDAVDLAGVVDLSYVSVQCLLVNNETLLDTTYAVRFGVSDVSGVNCLNPQLNRDSQAVGARSPSILWATSIETQCDNPITIRVYREAVGQHIG